MIIFSSSLIVTLTESTFVCSLLWEYLLLWYSLAVILIATLPDSIFVCYSRCSLFDCDFLDEILCVELPSNPF